MRSTQRGQALAEFLVAAVALIPLFLLVPLIGKYQDISNSTQLASRYVAFEAVTRNDSVGTFKPEAQLRDEVARRFFSNADAPIKTKDVAGDFKAHQNLLWRDPHDQPLIRDLGRDVQVSFGSDNSATHAGAFSGASDGALFSPVHGQLGLQARGLYRANVKVKLANLPAGLKFFEPFDRIDLSMARSTSLVFDPWTAKGPEDVEARIAGSAALFPAAKLASVSGAVDAAIAIIDAPGSFSGPKLGKLDFWRDVVPEDRLRSRN
jgi:hypothetical protein